MEDEKISIADEGYDGFDWDNETALFANEE